MLWWKSYNFTSLAPYNEVGRLIERLATGRGFSSPYGGDTGYTAAFPPLYPFLGSLIYRTFGSYTATARIAILAMNCIFGAANSILLHQLGLRTLGRRAGLLAAWAWRSSRSSSGGTSAGSGVLSQRLLPDLALRPHHGSGSATEHPPLGRLRRRMGSLLPCESSSREPIAVLWNLRGFPHWRSGKRWFTPALLSALVFFAVLSPWLIRNYAIFHKFIFVRDNFWLEFQLGNFHGSTGLGFGPLHPTGSDRLLQRFHDLGELGYMEDRKQLALSFLHNDPQEFRDLTLRRVLWFWDGTSVTYQANEWWQPWEVWWLSVVSLLGLLFAITRRPPGWVLISPRCSFTRCLIT